MPKADEAEVQPEYEMQWDPTTGTLVDVNLGTGNFAEGGQANVSLLTGKTWADMNEQERNAHRITRGGSDNMSDADIAQGQEYLDDVFESPNEQLLFSIAARDAVEGRMADGSFNYGPDGIGGDRGQQHTALYEAATYGNLYDVFDEDALQGNLGSRNPTLGITNNPYADTAGLTVGGEGDMKVWNPLTNSYEYYVNDDAYKQSSNDRGWYTNELGDRVLGFRGGPTGTIGDGTQSFVDDANRLAAWNPDGNMFGGTFGRPPGGYDSTRDDDPYHEVPQKEGNVPDNEFGDEPTHPGDHDDPWDPGAPITFEPPGYQGGYDWNWEAFQPGAPSLEGGGGYDPADYAFDRYVPGQESPWGIPDIQGGNKDFYRNQFLNLLKEEQGFSQQQRDAQAERSFAEDNPLEGAPLDWSWLGEEGLPDPFRMPYGAVEQGDSFGYSTEEAKYILDPRKGEYSMYVTNPAFQGSGGRQSGGGR